MKAKEKYRRTIWLLAASMFVLTLVLTTAQDTKAQWAGTTNIYNTNSGNVGIGTSSPNQKLSVNGNIEFQGAANGRYVITDESGSGTGRLVMQAGYGSAGAGGALNLYAHSHATHPGDIVAGISAGSGGAFRVNSSGLDGSTDWFYVGGTNGNVGIGTTSPQSKFSVVGSSAAEVGSGGGGIAQLSTGSGASSDEKFIFGIVDGSYGWLQPLKPGTAYRNLVLNPSSGNVGIGTTSPGAKLDVNGSIYSAGQIRANALSLLVWGADASGTNRVLSGAPNLESQDAQGLELGTSTSAPVVLYTGTSERLRIDGSTTTVTGNMTVTGNIAAKYQDVAEWVPSSEQLAAGTVVVLDSTKSNQVISSSVSYDTRVAGVISAQPGIALGEKTDSKVLVATTGRVKVKVDASKSSIHVGDLLVTSDIPGVAMRSEPVELAGRKMHMPGTLIGKALEPMEKGMGTILVLLSLQ